MLTAALEFLRDREGDVPAQGPAEQMVGTGWLHLPDLVGVVPCHLLHAGWQRLGLPQAAGLQAIERVPGIHVREQGQIAPAQAHHGMRAEQGRAVAGSYRHDQIEDAARCFGRRAEQPQGLNVCGREHPRGHARRAGWPVRRAGWPVRRGGWLGRKLGGAAHLTRHIIVHPRPPA